MELIITKDIEELSQKGAEWIADRIHAVLKNKDRFTIVLSGGNTPKGIYRLLASGKYKIDWAKLHFFWGDERYVPFADKHNNAKMAFDNLLDIVPIRKNQVHIMRTDIDPIDSANQYDQLLRNYFQGAEQTFDLVMLGMGDDGHTLSLFPGYDIIHEQDKWTKAFYLKEQDMYRITLTTPVVNAAASILFLVSGSAKAPALHRVLEDEFDPGQYPSQVIRPANDQLYWLVDEAAAADLE
jgi:6-phosphogluconolactonase